MPSCTVHTLSGLIQIGPSGLALKLVCSNFTRSIKMRARTTRAFGSSLAKRMDWFGSLLLGSHLLKTSLVAILLKTKQETSSASTESREQNEKKEYPAKISVTGKPEPIWQEAQRASVPTFSNHIPLKSCVWKTVCRVRYTWNRSPRCTWAKTLHTWSSSSVG